MNELMLDEAGWLTDPDLLKEVFGDTGLDFWTSLSGTPTWVSPGQPRYGSARPVQRRSSDVQREDLDRSAS